MCVLAGEKIFFLSLLLLFSLLLGGRGGLFVSQDDIETVAKRSHVLGPQVEMEIFAIFSLTCQHKVLGRKLFVSFAKPNVGHLGIDLVISQMELVLAKLCVFSAHFSKGSLGVVKVEGCFVRWLLLFIGNFPLLELAAAFW